MARQADLFEKRRWKARTYRGRYRITPSEDGLHEAVVALMHRCGLEYANDCIWYHPFNEIPLEDDDRRLAKRKGLQPGLLDLYFERLVDELNRERPIARMWFEFKRGDDLKLSAWQQKVKDFYVRAGVPVYLITTYRQAFALLEEHGFLKPGCK